MAVLALLTAVRTLYGRLEKERDARAEDVKAHQLYVQQLTERYSDKLEKVLEKSNELAASNNRVLTTMSEKMRRARARRPEGED